MPTIDQINAMSDSEIKTLNRKLSIQIAARILVPAAVGAAAIIVSKLIVRRLAS